MSKEYIIYCDESADKGKFYSNFYGGVIVSSQDVENINKLLTKKALELGFNGEVKWQKVTANYLDKYEQLINLFFDLIDQGLIKVRIMFTKNTNIMQSANEYQREYKYFLLYYQFIKHAFGLGYIPTESHHPPKIRLYLDQLPDTKEKSQLFKGWIHALEKDPTFRRIGLLFPEDQIAEINSKEHILLQCLDIVLGSMYFRLNDLHLEKPEGQRLRGKRTIAKEKLYKVINGRIRKLYPNFNIGISTSSVDKRNRWEHPYRHWLFVPADAIADKTQAKSKK